MSGHVRDVVAPAVSRIFGDIDAKAKAAIDEEVAERLRLGLPVFVDRGRGIEDLNQRPVPTVSAD